MSFLDKPSLLHQRALQTKCKGETLQELKHYPSNFEEVPQEISIDENQNIVIKTLPPKPKVLSPEAKEILTSQNRRAGLNNLEIHLQNCGALVKMEAHCKRCIDENLPEHLVKVVKEFIKTCGIRYCTKTKCITERYSKVLNKLMNSRRTKNLKNMFHFSIGFPKINIENSKQEKKHQEKVMNSFFKALEKGRIIKENGKIVRIVKPIKIVAYRVFDISQGDRKKDLDGKQFVHYHFACLPFCSTNQIGKTLKDIKAVEKDIKLKQRNKLPFHFQSYGYRKKKSILSYIALRSVGCFKKYETNKDEKVSVQSLAKQIRAGKFMLFKDFLTQEQYYDNFFNSRHINTINNDYYCFNCKTEFSPKRVIKKGKDKLCPFCNSLEVFLSLPYCSISPLVVDYAICKIHGKFDIYDPNLCQLIITEVIPPPPPKKPHIKPKFITEKIGGAL